MPALALTPLEAVQADMEVEPAMVEALGSVEALPAKHVTLVEVSDICRVTVCKGLNATIALAQVTLAETALSRKSVHATRVVPKVTSHAIARDLLQRNLLLKNPRIIVSTSLCVFRHLSFEPNSFTFEQEWYIPLPTSYRTHDVLCTSLIM